MKGNGMLTGTHAVQIIEGLKQVEGGRRSKELGRRYGLSKYITYGRKPKFGLAKRSTGVKQLRDEHACLEN